MNPSLQKELEMSRKSNDTEDIFDVLFTNRLGMLMTRLFIRLHITPNTVTLLSMFFGICGGILFYPKDLRLNLIGIFLEIFAAVLDCSDGQVARMTNTTSRLGRVLDGVCDGICAAAVYIGLGFRLMNEPVPFTGGLLWHGWIWPVILFCGAVCHQGQCRIADYYRIVHLYFLKGSELPRSKAIRSELESLPEDASGAQRFFLGFYYSYTKAQEVRTPKFQRLLKSIESNGNDIPQDLSSAYVTLSRKYIQMTNLLTYNLRMYTLFFLVLFRLHVFFFPFVIFGLSLIECIMVHKYEQIADNLYSSYV